MRVLRYWWWLAVAFLKKQQRVILAAAALSVLALAVVPRLAPLLSVRLPRSSRRVVGMLGPSRVGELPRSIRQLVSDGLVRVEPDGSVAPALATGWEVSEEGRRYTFTLDTGRSWHDGTPVTAESVVVSIPDVEVEIVDRARLAFRLQEPYAPFPTLMSAPVFRAGLVGVGSFRVERVEYNGEFVSSLELVSATGEERVYRFYRTTSELVSALKLGEVDEVEELTSLEGVPDWEELVVEETLHLDRYLVVFFNTAASRLSEKAFRQALTYAIPSKPTGERRALSPIAPSSWAYNPQVKSYETDLEQSRSLLAGVFAQGEEYPSLELTTTLPHLARAEEIAAAWSELGVKTEVRVATVAPEQFQVLLIGQQRPADPDQYTLWHSTQEATNITGYSSPRVDKLLEDGRRELDDDKRLEIYRDFQRFLVEDSPAAFLEQIETYRVRRG